MKASKHTPMPCPFIAPPSSLKKHVQSAHWPEKYAYLAQSSCQLPEGLLSVAGVSLRGGDANFPLLLRPYPPPIFWKFCIRIMWKTYKIPGLLCFDNWVPKQLMKPYIYWQKYGHLVPCSFGSLSLPRNSVVRLTDCLIMTIAVYCG